MKRFIGVLALVVLVMALGNAQQIGLKAVGGGAGLALFSVDAGTSSESLTGFAIGGVANLGELTPGLSLYPAVTYATGSKSIEGADWSVSDFAIDANVKYAFKGAGFTPYVGGGIGLNFVSTTFKFPGFDTGFGVFGGGEVTGSDTKIGFNVLAGGEFKVSNMDAYVQAGYHLISDVNHFRFTVGVLFPMN